MSSKLREALEAVYECAKDGVLTIRESAFEKVMEALKEPLRNCDVGTAEEQEVRFRNYCWNHSSRDKNMECQCPIDTEGRAGCKLEWSQLPYESEVSNA